MAAEIEKRKRSVNFSEDEKMRFLRIMQEKGQLIISKVTSHDLQSNRLKEDAWTEVTNAVNASRTTGSAIRNKDNLKKLWQKMKTEVKSFNHTNGTNEGPSKKMDDPILQFVAELTGCGSSVDGSPGSGVVPASDSDTKESCMKEESDQEKNNLKRPCPTESNSEESNQESPKSPKNSEDESLTNKRIKYEIDKWAFLELKKQQLIEEHAIKIKEGNLRTEILETVLKKIKDERPVDSELLKIVSYI